MIAASASVNHLKNLLIENVLGLQNLMIYSAESHDTEKSGSGVQIKEVNKMLTCTQVWFFQGRKNRMTIKNTYVRGSARESPT